jgi:putative Ca2+/H+ antiporter (TMEM165/GDT1 family)
LNWPLFVSIFSLIFIAELPDKTAFATLILASKGKPVAVFVGVALAFFVQSIFAIAFGRVLGLLPASIVHLVAGILFLAFAIYSWVESDDNDTASSDQRLASDNVKFFQIAWKSFVIIFIAEWGDLTQLATASLAARYPNFLWTVFISATLALWAVTGVAVVVGARLGKLINVKFMHKIGSIIFAAVGIYFVITWYQGR